GGTPVGGALRRLDGGHGLPGGLSGGTPGARPPRQQRPAARGPRPRTRRAVQGPRGPLIPGPDGLAGGANQDILPIRPPDQPVADPPGARESTMPSQLLDSLRSFVTTEVEEELAARLGAPGGVARRGLDAAFGSILAGLAALLPDSGSMRQVFGLVAGDAGDAAGTGRELLALVFGSRMDAVSEATARASGVRPDGARSLLAAAAPMVGDLLRRKVTEGRLDA